MTTSPADRDLHALGRLAQILDRGAVELWAQADQRPLSDRDAAQLAGLAADFFFAHAHVAHLLPPGHVMSSADPTQTRSVGLAEAAVGIVRHLPLHLRASTGQWTPHLTLEAMVGRLAEQSRAGDA